MEWLSNVLTSDNTVPVLLFLTLFIVIAIVLMRKGLFSFRGKGVTLGQNSDTERSILRTQIEWAAADCMDMLRDISKLPGSKDMNVYKGKYTIERVYDELVKIIILNHITLEPTYIKLKQDLIWAVVSAVNPEIKWDGLEEMVRKRVEVAIQTLFNIRKFYKY